MDLHQICQNFITNGTINMYVPQLMQLVEQASHDQTILTDDEIDALHDMFNISLDAEEMKMIQVYLDAISVKPTLFYRSSVELMDHIWGDVCADMMRGFLQFKHTNPSKWLIHINKPMGVISQYAKVFSACVPNEKEPCFHVIKATQCNSLFSLKDAQNEVNMHLLFQAKKLAPPMVDAFWSTNCNLNDKNKSTSNPTVFIVMKKKGFTLKEIFTTLLPKEWWDVEGQVSMDPSKLVGTIYLHGLSLLKKANAYGLFHMDPHLGNFMFNPPRKIVSFLKRVSQDWKHNKDEFVSMMNSGSEHLFDLFGLDTLTLIDFGMSNQTGPEDIDKFKTSFTKLRKLQSKVKGTNGSL